MVEEGCPCGGRGVSMWWKGVYMWWMIGVHVMEEGCPCGGVCGDIVNTFIWREW